MAKILNISDQSFGKAQKCLNYPIAIEDDLPYRIEALVKGSSQLPYEIILEKDENTIFGECSCIAFQRNDECKHIALLLMQESLVFNRTFSLDVTYKFYPRYYEDDFLFDDEVNLHKEEYYGRNTKETILEMMKKSSLLEESLIENTSGNKKVLDFYNSSAQSKKVACLHYYLSSSLFYGYDAETYILEFKCSSLLKSGKLGRPKRVNLNSKVIENLPLEDRAIAKEVIAFADWGRTYYGELTSFDSADIPIYELAKLIFQMAQTGRLYFEDRGFYSEESERVSEAVKYDPTIGELYFKVCPDSSERKLDFVIYDSLVKKNLSWDIKDLCKNGQFNEKLGVIFYKGQLFKFLPLIPLSFVEDLIFLDDPFSEEEWAVVKGFIVNHYRAEVIEEDYFELEKVTIIPQIQIYLKWSSENSISGLIIEDTPKKNPQKICYIDHFKKDRFLQEVPSHISIIDKGNDEFEFMGPMLFDFVKYVQQQGGDVLLDRKKINSSKSFKLEVSSGIDWFEVKSNIEIGDEHFDLKGLLKRIDFKSKLIELKNGEKGIIPEQWVNKVKKLVELSKKQGDKLLIHPSKVLLLNDFDFSTLHLDTSIGEWMDKVKSFEKIQKEEASKRFNGELRDYQKFSLGWFRFIEELGLGGCLADDMGLGKTIQMISYLQKELGKEKALIICPKSLTTNWKREFNKFAPELEVDIWENGVFKDSYLRPSILLVSYQLLTRHIKEIHDRNLNYRYLILDEAQNIKNPQSLTHKAVSSLKAKTRFALTGTPIENHVGELMAIFNFLSPGLFQGRNLKGKDFSMEDMNFLKPFLLRRVKEEVLTELPEKTVQVIYCGQEKKEKSYYQQLSKAILESVLEVDEKGMSKKNPMAILAGLTKLRQASCHVGLIEKDLVDTPIGKFLQLKEMLTEILDEGHKVVIFSQFTSLLKLVRSQLNFNDQNSCYLDGQTRKRDKVISEFKEIKDKRVFFVSLKAGGVGLNLTNASYCFLLDPWWNPAAESQAIDRIYRIGQKHPVHAYRMITKGTVEEKVLMLQEKKSKIADQILASNENFIQNLSQDDLKFLIE